MPPSPTGWRGWTFDLHLAFAFLTRVPLPSLTARADGALAAGALTRAMRVFPVVGATIGVMGALIYGGAIGLALSPTLAAMAAIAAMVMLTGGMHEDGLADSADGLGGRDRQRKLDIMRDSRTGTYGVLALIFSVGLRAGALAAMADPRRVLVALVVAGAMSRAAMPLAMSLNQPARTDGLGASAGSGKPGPTARIAVAGAGVLALAMVGTAGITVVVAMGVVTALLSGIARRQIGGYTGDVLGAVGQVVEIAVLLVLAR
ncbi:MAG: adenosylcobinamide-GDP ribazoletransferase [Alphaproteobacteria bacterium]|nr:adenosylcobinamide-GDP ribazoletransferase [Alphaproteobacteria bacterium]